MIIVISFLTVLRIMAGWKLSLQNINFTFVLSLNYREYYIFTHQNILIRYFFL